jgi:hypothetical protein
MQSPCASADEVTHAGIRLMAALYGGKSKDNLQILWYTGYCRQVSSSLRGIQPERLAPSQNAAYFHVLHVHLQAVSWKTLGAQPVLHPPAWGWKIDDGRYEPIMSDQAIAPDDILTVVRCACLPGKCDTERCSCRRNGIECVAACRNCRGTDYYNARARVVFDEDNSDDDDDSRQLTVENLLPDFKHAYEMDYADEETVE